MNFLRPSALFLVCLVFGTNAIAEVPAIRKGQSIECSEVGESKDPWTFKARFESDVPASVLSAIVIYDTVQGEEHGESAYMTYDAESGELMIRATQINGDNPRDIAWSMELVTNTKDLTKGTSSYVWMNQKKKSYKMKCVLK